MLTLDQISLLCRRLALSSQAQAVLTNIRSSPPSRRVGSGGKNVPVRYLSRKTGVIIQAESRTVEFAGVYLMEHDIELCDFSHTLSAPGGKVCPQKPAFTLAASTLKASDCGPLRAKCVQKYGLDANDVQKYYLL